LQLLKPQVAKEPTFDIIIKTKELKMKNVILLLCSLFLAFAGNSQVSERASEISLGSQNAFVTEHPGASKKMVTKILENAIKEFGKVKRNKKAKEWNCLQCDVPGISGPANVYFTIEEAKGMTRSYVFFDDGTQFISSDNNSDLAANLKKKLTMVGYDVTRAVISNELDDEEGNLKDRNKELSKLEKKNKDLHNDIEKYKKKISEAEAEIEKNLHSQEDKKMEIEKQSRLVEEVTEKLNAVGKG